MADTVTTNFNFVKPEIGGSTNSWGGKLNSNLDSLDTLINDRYTKSQVDTLINTAAANVGKRLTVRVATTASITVSTALNNGDTLDSVVLVTGDAVLVKNQSAPEQNGVWIVGVTPARATEFDTYDEHAGSLIAVQEGTTNADTLWLCTSNKGGTLNTTAIVYSKMVVAGELLAANNLSDIANAATARTNLGLAIGTNVQAFNAILADLAGITYAQGDILYHDGTNLVKLAKGTAAQAILMNSGATAPEWGSAGGIAYYQTQQPTSDVTEVAFTGLSDCRLVKFFAALYDNSSSTSIKFQARTSGGTWRDITGTFANINGAAMARSFALEVVDFNQNVDAKVVSGVANTFTTLDASDATNAMQTAATSYSGPQSFLSMPSWNEVWDEIKIISSTANAIEGSTTDQRGRFVVIGFK